VRYRLRMSADEPGPAERLVQVLETLPSDERQQITTWLIENGRGHAAMGAGLSWPMPRGDMTPRVATLLSSTDSQLVTIRLPAERHAHLRDWCAEHGFSMAAVVRGLVERFLEEQPAPGA
jgi:hypothetical protein